VVEMFGLEKIGMEFFINFYFLHKFFMAIEIRIIERFNKELYEGVMKILLIEGEM